MGLLDKVDIMNPGESSFVSQTADRLESYGSDTEINPKQLFWLRDLKDKYL